VAGEIQISGNIAGVTGIISPDGQITTAPSTTAGAGLTVPLGTAPTTPNPGDLFTDTNRKNLGICGIAGGSPVWLQGCVQTQGIQSAVPFAVPTAQTICSFNALNANILNSVGKRLIITGSGMYTTSVGEVPTITLNLFLLTKKVITLTSAAVTASQTNAPFWFHYELLTITAAGASSVVQGTGILFITTAAGVVSIYIYSTSSPTINIDLSSAGAPLLQADIGVTGLSSININEASLHITN
jgi:hypothetical protein